MKLGKNHICGGGRQIFWESFRDYHLGDGEQTEHVYSGQGTSDTSVSQLETSLALGQE